jgi:hypothetical protein
MRSLLAFILLLAAVAQTAHAALCAELAGLGVLASRRTGELAGGRSGATA